MSIGICFDDGMDEYSADSMRSPSKQELDSLDRYIKSISEPIVDYKKYKELVMNTKIVHDGLKQWLDNKEKGVVFIPEYLIEKWIKLTAFQN